jgi:hypothetical protein
MFKNYLLRIYAFHRFNLVSPFISFACPKETKQRKGHFGQCFSPQTLRAPRCPKLPYAQGFIYQLFKKISIAIFFIFPFLTYSQIFKKDRFVANRRAIVWTEHVEIKDMDTPIIEEALTEQLKSKPYVKLDSLQEHNVLTGWLLNPPAATISKARFQVDILYESYIVTVSTIQLEDKFIEAILLKSDGSFIEFFPEQIEKVDKALILVFGISH